jgi:ATP synthase protein I
MVLPRLPAFLTTPADADTPAVSAAGPGVERDGSPEDSSAPTPPAPPAPGYQGDGNGAGSAVTTVRSPAPPVAGLNTQIAPGTDNVASPPAIASGMEHYERLQRRLLLATAVAIAAAVPITGWLFDGSTALSLLLGGGAGLLYLRLLARSVSRLGGDRRSVGKIQLLVPVVLVLAASRIPALQILPALVGFLLYKPALIVQALLDR